MAKADENDEGERERSTSEAKEGEARGVENEKRDGEREDARDKVWSERRERTSRKFTQVDEVHCVSSRERPVSW